MGIEDINNNSNMIKMWIDNIKAVEKQYYKDNTDSLIPLFEKELRDLGYKFEISSQAVGFISKHKKVILPIAVKYYQFARELEKANEQNYFLRFFCIKGLDDVVPMLLKDYYSDKTADLTRWFISDCIYQIQSKSFVNEYLNIVSNKMFGRNRQMIVLLLGKLKEESVISTLIDLLDDEEVCLQAISALGEFKREEFRYYFERFQNSTHPGWRKYSRNAIKKLNDLK